MCPCLFVSATPPKLSPSACGQPPSPHLPPRCLPLLALHLCPGSLGLMVWPAPNSRVALGRLNFMSLSLTFPFCKK